MYVKFRSFIRKSYTQTPNIIYSKFQNSQDYLSFVYREICELLI